MEEAIRNFARQFDYKPEVKNKDALVKTSKVVMVGMGGSHLGPDLVKAFRPEKDILIVSDYGFPAVPKSFEEDTLFICSSHSGNTEEVLDAFQEIQKRNLPLAAISTGGQLLDLAEEHGVPYVAMPSDGIQPRSALGYSMLGLLKLIGDESGIEEAAHITTELDPAAHEEEGRKIAETMKGTVPVIYSSTKNYMVAYNWKIKHNETGKIPAFYNLIPELHHNEMTGFDVVDQSKMLSDGMSFIFLSDKTDHLRNKKRMTILEELYKDRGLNVQVVHIEGSSFLHGVFKSLVTADWSALHTAEMYGLEAEQVPMVEEFKKLMKE